MTPEERAHDLAAKLVPLGEKRMQMVFAKRASLETLIAQAIRQAENGAIERCALYLDGLRDRLLELSPSDGPVAATLTEVVAPTIWKNASSIRSLATKDP